MKIYLAGPMRGYEEFNFPAFKAETARLRLEGHKVFNPAERDIREDGFDPKKDTPRPLKEYMVRDLAEVCKADAVVVLPGWQKSVGAKLEVNVARDLGIPVLDANLERIPGEKSVLAEADELINGDRNAAYGPPNQDFQRTADMWTGLLQFKLKDGERIRAQDVAWMMILLKSSRAQHSDKRDNYVDAAGYAGCGWRCVESLKQPAG